MKKNEKEYKGLKYNQLSSVATLSTGNELAHCLVLLNPKLSATRFQTKARVLPTFTFLPKNAKKKAELRFIL